MHYFFISMQGQLIQVVKEEDIKKILRIMIKKAQEQYSESFLSAHGFDKKTGWDGVNLENQLIYKFEQKGNPIALKSI